MTNPVLIDGDGEWFEDPRSTTGELISADEYNELPNVIVGVDSYVSREAAEAMAASRLFSAPWTNADLATRCRALRTATGLLDRMRWQGRALAPTQPLAWPRVPEACPAG